MGKVWGQSTLGLIVLTLSLTGGIFVTYAIVKSDCCEYTILDPQNDPPEATFPYVLQATAWSALIFVALVPVARSLIHAVQMVTEDRFSDGGPRVQHGATEGLRDLEEDPAQPLR